LTASGEVYENALAEVMNSATKKGSGMDREMKDKE
jgi:hypothetical protein